jgi:hypothetical protein
VKSAWVVIKGAGEMASDVAYRLSMADITPICMTEIEKPLAARREISLCEAVFAGEMEVEVRRDEKVGNIEPRGDGLYLRTISKL